MKNRFQRALARENSGTPPIWLMRQAGRYHSHYQELKKRYSFMELCKNPEAAVLTTMGPIEDFDFDAAILFSDLLFPLESMGMGLEYAPGPKLDWHLKSLSDLERLKIPELEPSPFEFQKHALQGIRKVLPQEKGLLGFVGGPLTLYFYAVEGSHQGALGSARDGMKDGRFAGFVERLENLLVHEMIVQARAGADTIAMLDTCAGEVDLGTYRSQVVPAIARVLSKYHAMSGAVPVTYYSKGTNSEYWDTLRDLPIAGLGVDWKSNLSEVLNNYGDRWAIQGNIDPEWLHLESGALEGRLREVWGQVKREVPEHLRRGWICGLGHGVLQKTPESNVRLFVRVAREIFS
jgi:uroporphyrinogen decarboxylase